MDMGGGYSVPHQLSYPQINIQMPVSSRIVGIVAQVRTRMMMLLSGSVSGYSLSASYPQVTMLAELVNSHHTEL